MKKVFVACACRFSLSRRLPSHVLCVFLAVPARSLRDQPHQRTRPHDLAELSRPKKARVKRTSARATNSLATWPSPSSTRDRFHTIRGPGSGWQRSKQRPGQITCGQIWKKMSDAAQRREKQKWAIEKPRLDNARKLGGIYFIDPTDAEFKETIKKALKSWNFRCQHLCLARSGEASTERPVALLAFARQDMHASWKPANLRESVWKELYIEVMKIIVQEQMNSLNHCNLVHRFIPLPQAMKILVAKTAVKKERGTLEKIPAWQLTKVRNKKDVIDEARNKGRKIHFASLIYLCHLKNSALEPQFQKYRGRVVLRSDIVKDDSGSNAVFAEQGSSTSQMTAAIVMDIISRLPGCAGQAADAVSAYTQVKMEDAHKLLKIPKSECPDIWIRPPRHTRGQNHGPVWKIQSFLSKGIWTLILWQDYCGDKQFEKVLLKYGRERVSNWECLFVYRKKGLFLSVYVDDMKLAGKKQNIDPMWKVLMKGVDLGEPTSFCDHVYLGCTQRECKISKDIVDNYRHMFESRISASSKEKTS